MHGDSYMQKLLGTDGAIKFCTLRSFDCSSISFFVKVLCRIHFGSLRTWDTANYQQRLDGEFN